MTADSKSQLIELRHFIEAAENIAFFTGAGISTESGIPDFRSKDGIWTKNQPIEFSDFINSEEMRRESWRRKFRSEKTISDAIPNMGHKAIFQLMQSGKRCTIITQNIDNLHQQSGVSPALIIELHGNATYAKCLDCAKHYQLDEIRARFFPDETVPRCDKCEGMIKTATISFGQAMPENEMIRAQSATEQCDLFIVLGSSLVVYPAAGFPELAKQLGANLVIINRDPTPLDSMADLVINESIGETLTEALNFS